MLLIKSMCYATAEASQMVHIFYINMCLYNMYLLTTLKILLPSFKAFFSYSSFSPVGGLKPPVAGGPCNFIVAGGPLIDQGEH